MWTLKEKIRYLPLCSRSALSSRHHCCLHVVFLIYLLTLLGSLLFHCLYFILLQFLRLLSQVHAAKGLISALQDGNWREAETGSILSLCVPVYPPSSRWASFSSFMSTYYLSICHPCRCTVTSIPLQFAKVTAFHGPFFIVQKMLILFREGLGSQQNWVEVTEMFHISLAATHVYPPPFSIYVFFIFRNCLRTD